MGPIKAVHIMGHAYFCDRALWHHLTTSETESLCNYEGNHVIRFFFSFIHFSLLKLSVAKFYFSPSVIMGLLACVVLIPPLPLDLWRYKYINAEGAGLMY